MLGIKLLFLAQKYYAAKNVDNPVPIEFSTVIYSPLDWALQNKSVNCFLWCIVSRGCPLLLVSFFIEMLSQTFPQSEYILPLIGKISYILYSKRNLNYSLLPLQSLQSCIFSISTSLLRSELEEKTTSKWSYNYITSENNPDFIFKLHRKMNHEIFLHFLLEVFIFPLVLYLPLSGKLFPISWNSSWTQ